MTKAPQESPRHPGQIAEFIAFVTSVLTGLSVLWSREKPTPSVESAPPEPETPPSKPDFEQDV